MSDDSKIDMTPEAKRALDETLSRVSSNLRGKAERIARARGSNILSEQDLKKAANMYQVTFDNDSNPRTSQVKVKRHYRKIADGRIIAVRAHTRSRPGLESIVSITSTTATLIAFVALIAQGMTFFEKSKLIMIGGVVISAATAATLTMLLRVRKQVSEDAKRAGYNLRKNEFVSSWIDIEEKLRETVTKAMGEETGKEPLSSIHSKYIDIAEVPQEDRDTLRELQHLRNSVVHGQPGISETDLSEATARAKDLLRRMRKNTQPSSLSKEERQ